MSRRRSGPATQGPSPTESKWLGRAERLLARLVGAELAEAILGDLQELRPTVEARRGKAASWLWLALEIVGGAAALAAQRLRPAGGRQEEKQSMDNWSAKFRRAAAAIGLVACMPAAVLVTGGLLQSDWSTPALRSALERTLFNPDLLGFRVLIHPATVLSGLLLAAGLNLIPLLRVGVERRPGTLVGTLALRIRAAHLGVALLAVGLLGVILSYSFVENYEVVPTHVDGQRSGQVEGAIMSRSLPSGERLILQAYTFIESPGTEMLPFHLGDGGWRYGATRSADGTWHIVPTPPARGD